MRKKLPILMALSALVLALVLGAGLAWAARSSRSAREFAPVEGRLRPCPETPNCVCSDPLAGGQQVPPLWQGLSLIHI